jgi:predicted nucleic-acid-binding protein
MTGLDTTVVIRFMMQDDPVQSPLATSLFDSFTAEDPGFVSLVTLAETVWVLRSSYRPIASTFRK